MPNPAMQELIGYKSVEIDGRIVNELTTQKTKIAEVGIRANLVHVVKRNKVKKNKNISYPGSSA